METMNGMTSFLDRTGSNSVLDLSLQNTSKVNEDLQAASLTATVSSHAGRMIDLISDHIH